LSRQFGVLSSEQLNLMFGVQGLKLRTPCLR
jgi:hypothetical protein